MMSEFERRYNQQKIELRAYDEDGKKKKTARGYGAVFNQRSLDLGGFEEIVSPSAFDEVLENDVRGLFNHDPNFVLGRTTSGTLRLDVDETGLRYEIDLPDTQTVRDLVIEPMERGDITGSSFGFMVDEDEWSEGDDGRITRNIHKVGKLLDVSPVTYPAYPDTTVAMRSMSAATATKRNDLVTIDEVRKALDMPSDADVELVYRAVIDQLDARSVEIERLKEALEIRKRIASA